MRTRLLSLIAFAAVALASCTKENQQKPVAAPVNPLVGTWSIVKINSSVVDAGGNQVTAANYQQPLSAANIISFSKDSTANWSIDHFYQFGENGTGIIQQADFKSSYIRYSVQGKLITLSNAIQGPQGPMGPMAFTETETATMPSANSLVIHSVYKISADGSTVTADTYYKK